MERKVFTNNRGEQFSYLSNESQKDAVNFVFFHATGFNAQTYEILLHKLADKSESKFNVYALDQRGHGFTKLKANPQDMYDWKIYCDDLIKSVELFVEKTQKPIILSGHSMGAASAIQVAAIRPDLVSGLVLVDPVLMTNKIKVIFKIGRKYPLFKN